MLFTYDIMTLNHTELFSDHVRHARFIDHTITSAESNNERRRHYGKTSENGKGRLDVRLHFNMEHDQHNTAG